LLVILLHCLLSKVQAQIEAWKPLPLAIATALGPHLARLVP
jgi:hypothetical protein